MNIFRSTYRTSIIFFLAQRTRLKTPFTFLEHDHMTNRKFFRAFKKNWTSKKKDLSEISRPIFASFLRSSYTSLFLQYNPIGVPYGPNFFYWLKEIVQEYLLNTLNVVVKWKEKFLEALKQSLYLHKNYIRRNFNKILCDLERNESMLQD